MRLDVSQAARADLMEIHAYSRRMWGIARATAYLGGLREALRSLARGDASGQRADDVTADLRRLVVGSHVVWFRIEDESLRIIRVLHQSRDAGRWLE
jgi:toxin ParE1/3/4